jgi:hypothetical protein
MQLNKTSYLACLTASFLIILVTSACSTNKPQLQESNNQLLVEDFSSATLPASVSPFNAQWSLVNNSTDGQALKLVFSTEHVSSGIKIVPNKPWSIADLGNSAFMFDAINTGQHPLMLSVNVTAIDGSTQRRTIAIGQGDKSSLYFELQGLDLNVDTGLRDTPPSFVTDKQKMIVRGAKQSIDFSEISALQIYVETQINPTEVVIDNLRFASTPAANPNYLNALVDKFGQRNDLEFDLKVSSEQELQNIAQQELSQLANSAGWKDRSQFGGWLEGPQLQATGYFRTQKVNGKWALVDPQGYLFFSSSIANARMANTSTFTGVDYKDDSVRFIDPNDVTPEDSQHNSGNYTQAQSSAFIAYPNRHKMFNWLPDYSDVLANHYGYRRKSHLGPIEHGEVFSFYQANLERRYGETSPESYLDTWRQVTLDRMSDWGFTSFGNWTDPTFYNNTQVPYFANGWIIGDFKTLSSGYDYWGAMPDPFDPEFVQRAQVTVETIAGEVQNNPWCIGIFIDNEMSWGGEGEPIRRYGIVLDALTKTSADSPSKAIFSQMLQEKYQDINELNQAWQQHIPSWAALEKGVNYKEQATFSEQMLADLSWLLVRYADEYFSVVKTAINTFIPNHLYMGARFTTWGTSPEARWSAVKYADVISYNYYREGLDNMTWAFLEKLDKPSLIGEFHIGSSDTGSPNPGIIHAPNQKVRADMFTTYMQTAIDNPYIVGAHWFQYIDSPVTGRAHDGENYNVGFVTTTDIPYPHLVEAAKELHQNLYQRRFGDLNPSK